MNIHYIGHASIRIDTGNRSIITDPWMHGPAHCDQRHIFPRPVDISQAEASDVILISHGHQDHLHGPTLRRMRTDARVYHPYSWHGGTRNYLRDIGFNHITEAITSRSYALDSNTSVTYIANNLDSIIVVEHRGRVIVNAGNALHIYPINVIDAFVRLIQKRWPRIDTLFCGFGGTGCFPNIIHSPNKNNRETARAREQLFMHNFCRIVHALSPSVAVPFATDFVVLGPSQRWINATRFQRSEIAGYFRAYFGETPNGTVIHDMYPGDILGDGTLLPASPYRAQMLDGNLDHLIEEQYGAEIERAETTVPIPAPQAEKLRREIHENIEWRASLFSEEMLARLRFSIQVSDVAEKNCYGITFDGREPHVRRSCEPGADDLLTVVTTSDILRHWFGSELGGDAITTGYGADIMVPNQTTIETGLAMICMQLLTRHPAPTRHMLRKPLRAARFLLTNPLMRTQALQQLCNPNRTIQETGGPKEWMRRTAYERYRMRDIPPPAPGLSAANR